jgi:putative hydrolase of the HAD superfamily
VSEAGETTVSRNSAPVRAVFFDAGFTLLFPAKPVVDLYVDAARAVGAASCDAKLREAFMRAWNGGTRDESTDHRSSDALERERWHRFTLKVAREIPELLACHEDWLDQLKNRFDSGDGWRMDPDAPAVLRSLRDRGLKVAVVSNWHTGLGRVVSATGLADLVDFVVCSAEVGFRKPHPEIFHVALRNGGVSAESVVHVGDTWDEDVVGAAAVGITPVHLTNGAPPRASPPQHRTIRKLSEITDFL